MTPQDQYVFQVLQKYALPTGPSSPAAMSANTIAPLVRQWAGQSLIDLFPSGSYAKGTAVRGSTDIDLFLSFRADTQGTLNDLYESVFSFASRQGWSPRRQNVSIGINFYGTKIDLVPGRIQPGYQNYHWLYRRKADTWVQTNVSVQIEAVKKSQRLNEIRALKIWRNLRNLDIPSFYLELTVIDSLYRRPTDALADNVMHALQHIASNFLTARVIDPANTNNTISDDLTNAEKQVVAAQALLSTRAQTWEQIIW